MPRTQPTAEDKALYERVHAMTKELGKDIVIVTAQQHPRPPGYRPPPPPETDVVIVDYLTLLP